MFDKNVAQGVFITFEGGEGAGKSTQVKILANQLEEHGFKVLQTREPGGSLGAEDIRELLVTGAPDRWSASTETLLNFAARDDHLRTTIRPALQSGSVVICDRFMDSTRAYQGSAGGAQKDLIEHLEHSIIGTTVPDLTFIFDIDPDIGLSRTKSRNHGNEDRFENKPESFHQTLRQAFLDIANNEPERCVVIDASKSQSDVASSIWTIIENRLRIK